MPKKIYDIKPPKITKKINISGDSKKIKKERPKEIVIENKIKNNRFDYKKEKKPFLIPALIGVLVFILIVGIYLFFKLPKVTIFVWPDVDVLSFKQIITADKSVNSIDNKNSVIPAKYFQSTKINSQDFLATGNASNEGKASGNITIYNKYDPPESFTFKAGTRFISDSGKLFVSLEKIIIPAAKKSGGKIIPGSVQIKVQAAEGGDDYNIAPSSFSIPGLKGTAYYYSIYAKSDSEMSGGYAGKVKKVTEDDIQEAKDILIKKTTEDAISDLKNQISSDYILLENAVLSDVIDASTQTKPGTVVENFKYQVKIQVSALVFKKSDIDQFIKSYIISQIPEGKILLDNTLKSDYSASSIDVSEGKVNINLDCSVGVYQDIDKNSVSLSLIGQNDSQIRQNLNSLLGDRVSKFEIKFWPFWVKSAPSNQKAIDVELKF